MMLNQELERCLTGDLENHIDRMLSRSSCMDVIAVDQLSVRHLSSMN